MGSTKTAHAQLARASERGSRWKFGTQRLTTIGMFTALYAVARFIPTFPMYGLPGSSFRAGDFVAPAIGILLGPWLAIPCIILGTIINYTFRPPIFLGLDFLPALTATFISGLIARDKTKFAILFYAAILAIFLSLPLTTFWITVPIGLTIPYAWLHMIALLVLASPLGWRAAKWLNNSTEKKMVVALAVVVFTGTMAQHLTGGILQELILFPMTHITTHVRAASFWSIVFYIYPFERMILTTVTTIFLAALLRALKPSGLQAFLAKLSIK